MSPSHSQSVCRRPEGAQSSAFRHWLACRCGFKLFAHICVMSVQQALSHGIEDRLKRVNKTITS